MSTVRERPAVRDWKQRRVPLKVTGPDGKEHAIKKQDDSNAGLVVYHWPAPFVVPEEKGPLGSVYAARAAAGQLQAFVTFEGGQASSALWQQRAVTGDLRKLWLQKMGWPDDAKTTRERWIAAGGKDPGEGGLTGRNPHSPCAACAMDHVVELQVGGTNVAGNVAMLDAEPNRISGTTIWQTTSGIARAIRDALPDAEPPRQIGIAWDTADISAVPTRAATPSPKTCVDVELCAAKGIGRDGPATATGREPVVLKAGVDTATAQALPSPQTTQLLDDQGLNLGVVELIPGMILERLKRPKRGRDTVEASFESATNRRRRSGKGTQVPFTLKDAPPVELHVGPEGKLTLPKKAAHVKFVYPYLSEGKMTYKLGDDGKLSAEGTLVPSLPFLRTLKLGVWLRDGEFGGKADVDPKHIKLPLPGYRTTRSELGLELSPVFRPYGAFAFTSTALDGEVTASAGARGFEAHGTVTAKLPGVDKAQGKIDLVDGAWSGAIDIGKDAFSVAFVTSAAVHVGFSDAGLDASGQVGLMLPGNNPASLSVKKGGKRGWVYAGDVTLDTKIPGLQPVELAISYDGVTIRGRGSATIVIKGLTGTVVIHYHDGKLSGEGKIAVDKGRAKGILLVKVSPALAVSGEGQIEYRISDNLLAKAGIVLEEDRSVRLSGALEIPQPIPLFKAYSYKKELFSKSLDIPILGVSVGPASFGIIARITGSLGAELSVGPGELRGARIAAAFNPLEENPDIELQMAAQLVIPAYAGISVAVRGAVGVSVAIASVTGGITVRGDLGLRGGLESPWNIAYSKSRFVVDAEAAIRARPVLKLSLDADVTAEAGVGPLSVEKKWVWHLAGFEAGSDLEFGIVAPLHYASDEPFAFPSLESIKFVYPEIDASRILPAIVERAAG